MIKIYTLKRLRACRLTCSDGSVSITVNFEPSYGTQRSANGKVVISDPNIQRVMEKDPKFGKVYELTATHEDKSVRTSENIHGEKYIENPVVGRPRRTQAQIDAENAAKDNQVKDVPKVKATKTCKASNKANEKVSKKENVIENGLVFDDVNSAFAYFAEKGEHCTNEEELVELMQKYNASISE